MLKFKPVNFQSNLYGEWLLNLTNIGVTNSFNYYIPSMTQGQYILRITLKEVSIWFLLSFCCDQCIFELTSDSRNYTIIYQARGPKDEDDKGYKNKLNR